MSGIKAIRRIAVIGTSVIGASWTSRLLAKGLHVVAHDVTPNAETAKAAVSGGKSALVFEEHIL